MTSDAKRVRTSSDFPFKFGLVRVSPESLFIDYAGVRGAPSRVLVRGSTARTRAVQALLMVFAIGFATRYALRHEYVVAALYGLLAAWLVYWNVRYARITMVTEIRRQDALRITLERGMRPFTVDRFVVHLTENGQERLRLIQMPTTLQGGAQKAMLEAMTLLSEAGWPVSSRE